MFLSELFQQCRVVFVSIGQIVSSLPPEILVLGISAFATFLLIAGMHLFMGGGD